MRVEAGPLGRRPLDLPGLHLDPLGSVLDAVAAVVNFDQVRRPLGFRLVFLGGHLVSPVSDAVDHSNASLDCQHETRYIVVHRRIDVATGAAF